MVVPIEAKYPPPRTYIWNPAGSPFVLRAPPAAICTCKMEVVRDM